MIEKVDKEKLRKTSCVILKYFKMMWSYRRADTIYAITRPYFLQLFTQQQVENVLKEKQYKLEPFLNKKWISKSVDKIKLIPVSSKGFRAAIKSYASNIKRNTL